MRTGRPKAPVVLTNPERATLTSLANRSRTRPHLARRARLVLLCGDGLASNVVARKLHVRDQTVSKWRARFVRDRLDGLYDEPRPGAPRTIGDEEVERVLTRTLETTQPLLPMRPGQVERRTHYYKRHGTTSLFAALDLKTSKILSQLHRRHRSLEFRKFLDAIDAAVPAALAIHLIMDNYGTHKTALIRRWLAKRPRFHVHFTPTYGSWLNLVERWFAELTNKQVRRGVNRSVAG